MKKILIGIFAFLSTFISFAQNLQLPAADLNISKGEILKVGINGQLIYAENNVDKIKKSGMDIPEELATGVVVIRYSTEYYLKDKLQRVSYQMIYSNVDPFPHLLNASSLNPVEVNGNTPIGISKGVVACCIRIKNLDPHLTLCSQSPPLNIGAYWYYGVESLHPANPKFLTFQPISSKNDSIVFPDSLSNTFEEIVKSSEGDNSIVSFPSMKIRILTEMTSYPEPKENLTNYGEILIHSQYLSNMTLKSTVLFDGLKIHIYFPANFDSYFRKEYTLGDPIYFYFNIFYSKNRELHVYGRDFSLIDPASILSDRYNFIIQLNRQHKKELVRKSGEKEEDYFVKIKPDLPEGGYITYGRFFNKNKNTSEYKENTINISENWYNKDGNLIYRFMWYETSEIARNTTTYKYDDKNRIIETCYYDSKMYKEDGKWKVDPARSRLFVKNIKTYKDFKDRTELVDKEYRYSYLPFLERLSTTTYEIYNSDGVLQRKQVDYGDDGNKINIFEYDDRGNLVYRKINIEYEIENKYTYEYLDDKIIKERKTSLVDKSVVDFIYAYDENGNLSKKESEDYIYECKYNKNGRLIESVSKRKSGEILQKDFFRYDSKTGLQILRIEEAYGKIPRSRFWYTEFTKDKWESNLDPWALLENLPED